MIRKKSGVVAFICSLVPGAGEMYLGFMKEGLSIMLLVAVIFTGSIWLDMGWMISLIGIIWFYSLFNVHNKVSLPDEEFYALEDDYLFHMDRLIPQGHLSRRQTKVFGWFLILFGTAILWRPAIRNIVSMIELYCSDEMAYMIGRYLYSLPRFLFAVILIYCGLRLIQDKKKVLDMELTWEEEEKN